MDNYCKRCNNIVSGKPMVTISYFPHYNYWFYCKKCWEYLSGIKSGIQSNKGECFYCGNNKLLNANNSRMHFSYHWFEKSIDSFYCCPDCFDKLFWKIEK